MSDPEPSTRGGWSEAEELRELYERFLDERKGRTSAAHPEGARRVRLLRLLAPTQLE